MGRVIILDCLFVIILSIVFFKDLKTKTIPDYLNLILFLLGVIKIIFSEGDFEKSFIGMGVYPLILILIYGYVSDILKREVVGLRYSLGGAQRYPQHGWKSCEECKGRRVFSIKKSSKIYLPTSTKYT